MVSLLVVIGLIGGTMAVIYAMVKIPMLFTKRSKPASSEE